MERPKLIYFDGQGRAEVSRWIFLLAGVEYEDVRIQYSDWSTLKSSKFFRIPNLAIELFLSETVIITQSFIFLQHSDLASFQFWNMMAKPLHNREPLRASWEGNMGWQVKRKLKTQKLT